MTPFFKEDILLPDGTKEFAFVTFGSLQSAVFNGLPLSISGGDTGGTTGPIEVDHPVEFIANW